MTDSDPDSPANDNDPEIKGDAEAGSTVDLYTDVNCTSAVAATGSATDFNAPGLSVNVADDSTTTFYATATDAAGNTSACSTSSLTYREDSDDPDTNITGGPTGTTGDADPGPSPSPRTSPARPSSAASTAAPGSTAPRPTRRPACRRPPHHPGARDRPGRQHRPDARLAHLHRRHRRAEHCRSTPGPPARSPTRPRPSRSARPTSPARPSSAASTAAPGDRAPARTRPEACPTDRTPSKSVRSMSPATSTRPPRRAPSRSTPVPLTRRSTPAPPV